MRQLSAGSERVETGCRSRMLIEQGAQLCSAVLVVCVKCSGFAYRGIVLPAINISTIQQISIVSSGETVIFRKQFSKKSFKIFRLVMTGGSGGAH